jgi:shikimate kinase
MQGLDASATSTDEKPAAGLAGALPAADARAQRLVTALAGRPLVLVGLMGSGKSSVGRRLANRLHVPFVDADTEIELAAGMSIPEIFANHGEPSFRDGERRVIARLLTGGGQIIATGGGAFMNAETRARIAETGISLWLDAEVEVLMRRVRRRGNRPLLQTDDPEETMRALMAVRNPVYATADIRVASEEGPHEATVEAVMAALEEHLGLSGAPT